MKYQGLNTEKRQSANLGGTPRNGKKCCLTIKGLRN